MNWKTVLIAFQVATLPLAFSYEAQEGLQEQKTAQIYQPETIQILLHKDLSEALVEVTGPYYIYNPYTGHKIASGILGKRYMVHPIAGGIKWGEVFPGIHQLLLTPRARETTILINGVSYNGAIAIYQIGDKISVINHVDIEEYLKATLPEQFLFPLDKETMAAIAILARTNSYYQVYKNQGKFWHIEAQDSGYMGSAAVVSSSPSAQAVDATHHIILTHHNMPFAATWTEHSGGKTASYQAIFRKNGSAPEHGVPTPHALFDKKESAWNFQIDKEKLASLFNLKDVKEIELFVDHESGKAYAVKLKGDLDELNLDFFTFQNKVGKEQLLSNDFSVGIEGGKFKFSGFGKGHGVGLCLYSAAALTQHGANAADILKKFYPDTSLINLLSIPQLDLEERNNPLHQEAEVGIN